jgi:hypothetical protein
MRGEKETDTAARHRKISIIMLVVLVASVFAAWQMTLTTGQLTRNGAQVVAALRKKGADAIWPTAREHWTISSEGRRPVGWSFYAHRREPDGTYRGIEVNIKQGKKRISGNWSTWRLSNQLTSSLYTAGSVRWTGQGILLKTDTTTTFKDGSIHLKQRTEDGLLRSQAGAGDNYIPEGALPLVRAMVAQKETEAKFESIYDYKPPRNGVIQFNKLIFEYRGKSDRYENASELLWRPVGGRATQVPILTIDSAGFTLRKEFGNEIEQAVSRQDVLNTFPRSDAILRSVLRQAPEHWPEPQAPIDPNAIADDALDANS